MPPTRACRSFLLFFVLVVVPMLPAWSQNSTTPPVPSEGLSPAQEGGKLIYAVSQFARFGPLNAADMVQQIPGFTISQVSGDRGLGDATQNVLINGQRITSKNTDAQTVLARIPVSTVARLEIVEGATLDIPGLSGQVLNVVTNAQLGQGSYAWRPQWRPRIPDHWTNTEINWSDKLGAGEYSLGFTSQGFRGGGFGNEVLTDASRAITSIRDREFIAANDEPRLSATYTRTAGDDAVFNLNTTVNWFRFKNRVLSEYETATADAIMESRRNRNQNLRLEIGSDYSFALGEGRLKIAGLWRDANGRSRNRFVRDVTVGTDSGQQFRRDTRDGERVLRAEYRWKQGAGDWQVSAEGAFNFLDAKSQLQALDSNGTFQPVPLPGGAGRIEEKRGQAIASYSRPLARVLSLQASLGGEFSQLSLVGADGQSRQFWRPKGSLALAYKPHSGFDLNLRLQRRVGQLNFEDFLASVDVQNNNNNAGNPSLVPPQSWLMELEANRSLGRTGSVKLKIEAESIADIVDQVPISATEEAVGNLPSAERFRASLRTGVLLDGLGLRGGRVDATLVHSSQRLRDPLLGTRRSVSFAEPWSWNLEFRHDVPATPWVWGFQSDHAGRDRTYRLDYDYYQYRNRPQLILFAEHKSVFGLKVRAMLQNTLGRRERSVEAFYADRRDGPVSFYQIRTNEFGLIYRLQISGTF
jgi:outer membrane receptor for ferrienterochelin and colicins